MYQHSTIHFCCWDSAGLFAFMTFRPLPFPWAPAVSPITWSMLGYCKLLRLPVSHACCPKSMIQSISLFCVHCTKIQVWCDSVISSWKDWIVGADPGRLESWWSFHTLEANLRRHEKMMKVHLHYLLNLPCSCSVRFQHTCWKRQQFTSTKVWWPLRFFNGAHPVHGTLSLKDILDELQHVR